MKYKDTNIIFCFGFFILFSFACNHNNDELFLKELKQQNNFLQEQYDLCKNKLFVLSGYSAASRPYVHLFAKRDTSLMLFFKSLNVLDDKKLDSAFMAYKTESNEYFLAAQKNVATKFLPLDAKLLMFKNDSNYLKINNSQIKREFIKKHFLQHYMVIGELCRDASSFCNLGFTNPNYFGYRLTVQKEKQETKLNLKCFDNHKTPYFVHLEFVSLSEIIKGEDYYEDKAKNIKAEILKVANDKDALIIKAKSLHKGFYEIICNKLSISETGRLVKEAATYSFEID